MQVIGSQFRHRGADGDFGWMIEQPEYDDALFIFNDNQEQFLDYLTNPTPDGFGCEAGGGNAVIRPYRCVNPPRAAGLPTGSNGEGYAELTPAAKHVIAAAFGVVRETLASGRYRRIFYSAANTEGDLGTGIFEVGDDVKKYIVDELRQLADHGPVE
jgi:hypothetical protein